MSANKFDVGAGRAAFRNVNIFPRYIKLNRHFADVCMSTIPLWNSAWHFHAKLLCWKRGSKLDLRWMMFKFGFFRFESILNSHSMSKISDHHQRRWFFPPFLGLVWVFHGDLILENSRRSIKIHVSYWCVHSVLPLSFLQAKWRSFGLSVDLSSFSRNELN